MIAREIIDHIKNRTEKGLDKDGKFFPAYSKSYKQSLDFKLAGKSSKVNLRLTNEMMESIDLLANRTSEITIGYQAGDSINGKVEGNRIGSYGGKRNPFRARDFLGLTDNALKKILKKFPLKDKAARDKKILELLKAAAASDEILDDVILRNKG